MSTPPVRSLADDLRGRNDEQLRRLLTLRPDLLSPVPNDLSALAARSLTLPSIARALDSLNAWLLQVLESVAALDEPTSMAEVVAATTEESANALNSLAELALIYQDHGVIRIPRPVREALGNEPAGLGPRSGFNAAEVKSMVVELKKAAKESRAIIDQLRWGPPRGEVGDTSRPGPHLKWLIENKIMQIVDKTHVVVPLEIGLALRDGKTFREFHLNSPSLLGESPKRGDVDRAGALEASGFLIWIEELLDILAEEPATALRAGGMGVRDLRRLAQGMDIEESVVAFVAESAFSIGLIGTQLDDQIMPTTAYDIWLSQEPAKRWQTIVEAWISSSRVAGLVGTKDPTSKSLAALGPELDRAAAMPIRGQVLDLLAAASPMAPTLDSIAATVAWQKPRRSAHNQRDLVSWTLREAALLGVTGRGALTSFAAEVLRGDESNSLAGALPPPVDHILVQGDHTAIAPGPLTPTLLRAMMSMAKIESRGSATVFRFTQDSIRHALDTGATAEEIQTFLAGTSKTPIPQSLVYLVNDVARKHGRLRVGGGLAYLRCDDENLLAEAMKDRRLSKLNLRRLAPTILISEASLDETIKTLRTHGFSPVAEASDGGLILHAPKVRRAAIRPRSPRMLIDSAPANDSLVDAALRAIRAGDRASIATRTAPSLARIPSNPTTETVEALLEASKSGGTIWIGYADTDGGVSNRIVEPASILGGHLTAFDHGTGTLRRFAIHRITGVAELDS
ncbi:MAG TPA: helicase-associated domain-containing protein [Candidatus Nanopelagicaceae bacterium]|nr:helicase-associated domain-containing protein [Candidatus Nanopelagicaceae bacterium]